MRKVASWTIVISLLIVVLSGCSKNAQICHLIEVAEQDPICEAYPVRSYYSDGEYIVILFESAIPVNGVSFSSDRQATNVYDMELVSITNIQEYIGKPLSDVEADLGEYCIDIGSGQCMPSYITEDGYLICFTVGNQTNTICHTGKTDLLTGESVEWYYAD